jgi:hypothetical protein
MDVLCDTLTMEEILPRLLPKCHGRLLPALQEFAPHFLTSPRNRKP